MLFHFGAVFQEKNDNDGNDITFSGTFSTHHKQKNIISTKKVVSIVFYGFC